MIIRKLSPVRAPSFELQAIEKRLKALWWELFFKPLLQGENLPEEIKNETPAYPAIELALSSGRLTFNNGIFSGKFNAAVSRELKKLGAWWQSKDSTFHLATDKIPVQITRAIELSETRFVKKLDKLDAKLVNILDKKVWKQFSLTDLFDKAIFRMDKEFRKNVETVTIQPKVTDFQAKKISEEWEDNLERDIKKFTEKQVQDLRALIKESYFKGDRYGSLIKAIQKIKNVSDTKAEFLARNETRNLAAAYHGARYVEAGIPGYHWHAVAGTIDHPTRHRHKELSEMSAKGKVFYWDDPPRTTEEGQPARYNNPGEDYNCRCSATPVYEGKK